MAPSLFSPLDLGSVRLKHRVVMAPLTRMRAAQPGDVPTALNTEYYGQRASNGGLIITEATQISLQGKGFPRTPGIYSDEQVAGWRSVTDAVHAKGGVIFSQLWHTGRVSHSSHRSDGSLPVAPSAVSAEGEAWGANFQAFSFETPRALKIEEIPGVVDQFRNAAEQAKRAGFDGVEVHAANGFLIDQFLQDRTNRRTDRYGGSIENRARFLFEVLDAVSQLFDNSRIGVRLSPYGNLTGMADSDPVRLFTQVIEALSAYKIAYLHLIEPRADAVTSNNERADIPESVAALFRSSFDGPLIAAGGFTQSSAEAAIAEGRADAIAFGRLFISNPDLPQRFASGAPLAAYDRSTFHGGEAAGYTDYPALDAAAAAGIATGVGR